MSAHTQLIAEGADVATLVAHSLDPNFGGPERVKAQEEAIKCLQVRDGPALYSIVSSCSTSHMRHS